MIARYTRQPRIWSCSTWAMTIEVTTRTGSTTNSLRLLTTAAWKIGSANRER